MNIFMVQGQFDGAMAGVVCNVCAAGSEVTCAQVRVCVCLGFGRCYISVLIDGFSSPWSSML